MNTKLWSVLFVVCSWLSANLALAHNESSCSGVSVKGFTETPPMYLHESPSLRVLGKRWSTSNELKTYFDQQKKLLQVIQEQAAPGEPENVLKLASVGDVMRLSYSQPDFVDEILKEYFDSVDVLTGNLETLISPKYPVPPDSLFQMNSDPSLLTAFRNSENHNYFSVMSTANNHTFDYPDDAILDTLAALKEEGIWQSGIRTSKQQKPYLVFETKGIRIGYYAITTFVNSKETFKKSKLHLNPMVEGIEPIPFAAWKEGCEIDLSDTQRVLKQMKQDGADISIISIHWGEEHDMYPQPVQLDIAHQLVQQGADVIVGAHSHVPQPAEICFVNGYEDRLDGALADQQKAEGCVLRTSDGKPRKAMIYYSLGNFTSYSPFFWQQLGTIGELSLVKQETDAGAVVDWFAPNFVFTYDHVDNPPHGKRHLNLLNNYIVRGCNSTRCPETTKILVGSLKRHLYGESLNIWEEFRVTALTTYVALKEIIYWQLFSSEASGSSDG
ncbi:MAG: CapA family protein [Pseudomonadales bacterium]|nr:CapA family protein [Pseudomonadales bacterium]